jgi:hypothetical protein
MKINEADMMMSLVWYSEVGKDMVCLAEIGDIGI